MSVNRYQIDGPLGPHYFNDSRPPEMIAVLAQPGFVAEDGTVMQTGESVTQVRPNFYNNYSWYPMPQSFSAVAASAVGPSASTAVIVAGRPQVLVTGTPAPSIFQTYPWLYAAIIAGVVVGGLWLLHEVA